MSLILWETPATNERAQAITDGALIDVSSTANSAGLPGSVCLSAAVWADVQRIPASKRTQDTDGRLWDVLWMASAAWKRHHWPRQARLIYSLVMHVGRKSQYTLKLVVGPGDDGKTTCFTIMQPHER